MTARQVAVLDEDGSGAVERVRRLLGVIVDGGMENRRAGYGSGCFTVNTLTGLAAKDPLVAEILPVSTLVGEQWGRRAGFVAVGVITLVTAVIAVPGIGFVGVTMNPAMSSRVQRIADARPLVDTIHSSFITLGVVVGSWTGGLGIDEYGLRAPCGSARSSPSSPSGGRRTPGFR
ncbi:hypothetical protein [Streptomyces sp. WAC08241]|uniref:hypothetical protein n=1 Tax=Streptomyces sp. WAC08241 TaxID=2487421 RepID=UPI00163D29A5|nr:hypothetical protein [Streptomyces sp. WAC08241]